MDIEALAKESHRIGRERKGGPATHAFDLSRSAQGGLAMHNLSEVTDSERHMLMAHFGRPIEVTIGHSSAEDAEDGRSILSPGTPEHFVACVYRMPPPFIRLPKE